MTCLPGPRVHDTDGDELHGGDRALVAMLVAAGNNEPSLVERGFDQELTVRRKKGRWEFSSCRRR